jgi:hypothetical protein
VNEKRVIMEWTSKAPGWNELVEYYRSRPGHMLWLSNRHPVLRGEIEDTPEPTIIEPLEQEVA